MQRQLAGSQVCTLTAQCQTLMLLNDGQRYKITVRFQIKMASEWLKVYGTSSATTRRLMGGQVCTVCLYMSHKEDGK